MRYRVIETDSSVNQVPKGTVLMQHEMCSSKENGLKSCEKHLDESIEISSPVSGQVVHKVWEEWSTSVLIVKGFIRE